MDSENSSPAVERESIDQGETKPIGDVSIRSRQGLMLSGLGVLFGLVLGWLLIIGFPASGGSAPQLPTVAANLPEFDGPPSVGSPAPDFELQTYNGGSLRLSELSGRPVLINFWATWCGPCRVEMPSIQAQFEKHAPGLSVLAINFDESAEVVGSFVDEIGLTFDVLLDPGGVVNEKIYQVRGYPSSYFIDKDGIVQVVHIGIMTEGQLEGYLEQLGLQP